MPLLKYKAKFTSKTLLEETAIKVVPKNLFSVENQKIEEKNGKVDDPPSYVDTCLEDNSIINMNTNKECNKMHFRSEYVDMTLMANPFLKERFIIKTSESTLNENVVDILQNLISSQKFIIENEGMKEMPLTTCKAGNSKICTEDNKANNATCNVNSDFCTNSMKSELCSFGNNETICKTLSFLFASQFSFPNTCKKNEVCNNNESVVMPYINVHKKTQDSIIKISTNEEQHSVFNVDKVRTDESKNQLFNETSSLATDDKLFENMNISYCNNDSNYDIQKFSFISQNNSYTKLEIKEINQSNEDISVPKLNFSDMEMIKEDYSANLPQENIDCHNVNFELITGRNLNILPQKSASFYSANGKPIIINKNSLQQAKEMWDKVTNDSWNCNLNQHNPNINHNENNYAKLLANTFQNTNENVSKLNSINAQKFCRDPVNNNTNLIELNTAENYSQSKHINSKTDQKELIELPSTDNPECKLNIDSDKNLSTESTYSKNFDIEKEIESQVYHSPDFPLTQVMEVAEITYACLQEMEKGFSHTFSQFSPNPTKINNDFQNVNEVNLFQCGENILEDNSMKHMDNKVKYFNIDRSIIQKSNLDTIEDKINTDPLIISRRNNLKNLGNHASEKQIKCRTELFKTNNNLNCLFSNIEDVKKETSSNYQFSFEVKDAKNFKGFTTASGKDIHLSEKALNKSKEIYAELNKCELSIFDQKEEINNNSVDLSLIDLDFYSDVEQVNFLNLNKKESIKELAVESFNENINFNKTDNTSKSTMTTVINSLNENSKYENKDYVIPNDKSLENHLKEKIKKIPHQTTVLNDDKLSFFTAAGKECIVSEDALQTAKKLFNESSSKIFTKGSDIEGIINENNDKNLDTDEADYLPTFDMSYFTACSHQDNIDDDSQDDKKLFISIDNNEKHKAVLETNKHNNVFKSEKFLSTKFSSTDHELYVNEINEEANPKMSHLKQYEECFDNQRIQTNNENILLEDQKDKAKDVCSKEYIKLNTSDLEIKTDNLTKGGDELILNENIVEAKSNLKDENPVELSDVQETFMYKNYNDQISETLHADISDDSTKNIPTDFHTEYEKENVKYEPDDKEIEIYKNKSVFKIHNSKFPSFSTASGKKICISSESLSKAKTILNDISNDNLNEIQKIKDLIMTNSESIEQLHFNRVSDENTHNATYKTNATNKLEFNLENNAELNDKNCKYYFENENNVILPEKSDCANSHNPLKSIYVEKNFVHDKSQEFKECKKQYSFKEEEINNSEITVQNIKIANENLIQTESHLQIQQQFPSDISKFPVFNTASGKKVTISENALKKAKTILNNDPAECNLSVNEKFQLMKENETCELLKFPGFSTAAGKSVVISENSIQAAKILLKDSEIKLNKLDEQSNTKFGFIPSKNQDFHNNQIGFNSAAGKKILISEAALNKAKLLFQHSYTESNNLESNFEKDKHFSNFHDKNKLNSDYCDVYDTEQVIKNHSVLMKEDKKTTNDNLNDITKSNNVHHSEVSLTETIKRPKTENNNKDRKDNPVKRTLDELNLLYLPQNQKRNKIGKADFGSNDIKDTDNINDKVNFNLPQTVFPVTDKSSIEKKRYFAMKNQEERIKNKYNKKINILPGKLWITKTSGISRQSLRKFVNNLLPFTSSTKKIYEDDVSEALYSSTALNAIDFTFKAEDYFDLDTCNQCIDIKIADGMTIVLNKSNEIGIEEICKAFLDGPGVDPNLVNNDWIHNHYTWIVWKLSAMEKAFPCIFLKKCLTPENVLLQLKYRYDKEIDQNQRKINILMIYEDDVSEALYSSTALNAIDFTFKAEDYFDLDTCNQCIDIKIADGMTIVLNKSNEIGIEEICKAFLDGPGVDPNLVNNDWIHNHYTWIVWKLSAMEKAFPCIFLKKCLTPENVLLQLKYRYDKEIDQNQRSALKKIMERDDTPVKTMILCIAEIKRISSFTGNSDLEDTTNEENEVSKFKCLLYQ
ncbi:breast cancer type 2 susceptibility protein homolog [Centruroides sculpturatus]|uniref:breast cancer type 2 susceptibility protein homolog n=1 Tax=Centruroides sculpturatus TaxID=218467 RepID=UPI000C6D6A30|nr:breast cancer type 2 susceptibility protein homolog [Centruroides sculpturatus]